ncbi:MAG: PH domain-containing protein, partial [Nocardioidaceae bacterium]|nr:PH domain-containing protein [Nocardioidaceae bacterium]
MALAGVGLQLIGAPLLWPLVVAGLVIEVIAGVLWFVVVPRVVSSWRYAERAEDLLIRHGRIYRRLTVVPYGRMQVIEVSANPISHRLGIATVTLVTASADTNAKIPGLPTE